MSHTVSLRRQLLVACAVALVSLAGCIVVPARGGRYMTDVVTVAPPAPRFEVVGVAPFPGYVRIGGYWGWGGGRHEWVPGRWEAPRPGYTWEPHAWEREGGGWRLRGGYWAGRS